MSEEVHEVVKLLVARIESHPEEFMGDNDVVESDSLEDRWWHIMREVREYGTDAEVAAVKAAMRKSKLQKAHEVMMDELCNGEERRRKRREADEEERKRYAHTQALQQQMYAAQQQQNVLANPYNSSSIGIGTVSPSTSLTGLPGAFYDADTDTYNFGNGYKMTKAQLAESNPGLVSTIKKALGL
jgi:hypothetical protein